MAAGTHYDLKPSIITSLFLLKNYSFYCCHGVYRLIVLLIP